MRADVQRDMSKGTKAFVEIVWPKIAPILGDGNAYMPVEGGASDELAHYLDTIAGIDGFQIREDRLFIRGIATRVQWIRNPFPPFNTFTVRARRPSGNPTEREKRLCAIQFRDHGPLFPDLTIQAYLREETDELLSAGIVKTVDLYACVQKHPSGVFKRAGNGGEEFEVYAFDYLQSRGYPVKTWEAKSGQLTINGHPARPRKVA